MSARPFLTTTLALALAGCHAAASDSSTDEPAHSTPESKALAEIRAIGRAHGGERLADVAAIRFTFHVEFGDRRVARRWTFEPESKHVQYADPNLPDIAHDYHTGTEPVDERTREVDGWFVNDSFWLLFPLHLATHEFAAVSRIDTPAPDHVRAVRGYTVRYPDNVGYTPGDRYDFWVDADQHLTAWRYFPGNAPEARLTTTWADYCQLGPLRTSLDHVGEGTFRLWFSDVTLLRKGQTEWESPIPVN